MPFHWCPLQSMTVRVTRRLEKIANIEKKVAQRVTKSKKAEISTSKPKLNLKAQNIYIP